MSTNGNDHRMGEDTDPPDSPPPRRPGSGKHDIYILVIGLSENVHENQRLLVRQGVESDRQWADHKQASASQQGLLRRLSDQALLQGADIGQLKATVATVQRDVGAILESLGKIAGELAYRATQDSIHDEVTEQHEVAIARQETKLRRFAQLFTYKAFAQGFFVVLLGSVAHVLLKALGH